ncbi:MAG: hypothetical protein INR70_05210 [Parafilimonas terrae]|nr:hypothetical protein [Parafilimonas terrae]
MSSLIEFAERELRSLPHCRGWDGMMADRDIIALVALFDAQRHSGASARFVTDALVRLLRWQKLDAAENDPAPTDAERQRDLYAATLRNALVAMEAKKTCPNMRAAIRTVLDGPPSDAQITDPVLCERAECAYLAEAHTGTWDNATAEAIASAIRERGTELDDTVLVFKDAWAKVQPIWMLLRHGVPLPADLAQAIDARRAETNGLGAKHESAVGEAEAPVPDSLQTQTGREGGD